MTPKIELVTTSARLACLERPWRVLWEHSGADVFQSYEWIETWGRSAALPGIQLRIGIAWYGDAMLAVLPLAVRRRSFIRSLEWVSQEFSDYCDALIEPDASILLVRQLWIAIHQAGGFDVVRLAQVRPDSRVRQLLENTETRSGKLQLRESQIPCLGVAKAWTNGEAWFRSLNKKARNNFTRGRRILYELGGEVVFEVVDPARTPVEPILRHVLALKRNWLQGHEPNSPLLGPDGARQQEVLLAALNAGLMRIFLLTCGGTIAAASLNFVYEDKLQAYLTAYDERYERASPGTILIIHYVKWAFARELRYVDFLRGDEPFKFRFANADVRLTTFVGARTWSGRAALFAYRWYSDLYAMLKRWSAPTGECDEVAAPKLGY
jgi:CelD/BcsL family acetyltransferase involved in cellulose biosynthesis